jgi:hypothetical protein
MRQGERPRPKFKQLALKRMLEARNTGLRAQELEVSVRTLYRWRDHQLGREKKVREPVPREEKLEAEIQRLKQSLANRTLEWIFSGVPCKKSRLDVGRVANLARGHLRPNPGSNVDARSFECRADSAG